MMEKGENSKVKHLMPFWSSFLNRSRQNDLDFERKRLQIQDRLDGIHFSAPTTNVTQFITKPLVSSRISHKENKDETIKVNKNPNEDNHPLTQIECMHQVYQLALREKEINCNIKKMEEKLYNLETNNAINPYNYVMASSNTDDVNFKRNLYPASVNNQLIDNKVLLQQEMSSLQFKCNVLLHDVVQERLANKDSAINFTKTKCYCGDNKPSTRVPENLKEIAKGIKTLLDLVNGSKENQEVRKIEKNNYSHGDYQLTITKSTDNSRIDVGVQKGESNISINLGTKIILSDKQIQADVEKMGSTTGSKCKIREIINNGVHSLVITTSSGNLEVTTRSPEGFIESTLTLSKSGNVHFRTEVAKFGDNSEMSSSSSYVSIPSISGLADIDFDHFPQIIKASVFEAPQNIEEEQEEEERAEAEAAIKLEIDDEETETTTKEKIIRSNEDDSFKSSFENLDGGKNQIPPNDEGHEINKSTKNKTSIMEAKTTSDFKITLKASDASDVNYISDFEYDSLTTIGTIQFDLPDDSLSEPELTFATEIGVSEIVSSPINTKTIETKVLFKREISSEFEFSILSDKNQAVEKATENDNKNEHILTVDKANYIQRAVNEIVLLEDAPEINEILLEIERETLKMSESDSAISETVNGSAKIEEVLSNETLKYIKLFEEITVDICCQKEPEAVTSNELKIQQQIEEDSEGAFDSMEELRQKGDAVSEAEELQFVRTETIVLGAGDDEYVHNIEEVQSLRVTEELAQKSNVAKTKQIEDSTFLLKETILIEAENECDIHKIIEEAFKNANKNLIDVMKKTTNQIEFVLTIAVKQTEDENILKLKKNVDSLYLENSSYLPNLNSSQLNNKNNYLLKDKQPSEKALYINETQLEEFVAKNEETCGFFKCDEEPKNHLICKSFEEDSNIVKQKIFKDITDDSSSDDKLLLKIKQKKLGKRYKCQRRCRTEKRRSHRWNEARMSVSREMCKSCGFRENFHKRERKLTGRRLLEENKYKIQDLKLHGTGEEINSSQNEKCRTITSLKDRGKPSLSKERKIIKPEESTSRVALLNQQSVASLQMLLDRKKHNKPRSRSFDETMRRCNHNEKQIGESQEKTKIATALMRAHLKSREKSGMEANHKPSPKQQRKSRTEVKNSSFVLKKSRSAVSNRALNAGYLAADKSRANSRQKKRRSKMGVLEEETQMSRMNELTTTRTCMNQKVSPIIEVSQTKRIERQLERSKHTIGSQSTQNTNPSNVRKLRSHSCHEKSRKSKVEELHEKVCQTNHNSHRALEGGGKSIEKKSRPHVKHKKITVAKMSRSSGLVKKCIKIAQIERSNKSKKEPANDEKTRSISKMGIEKLKKVAKHFRSIASGKPIPRISYKWERSSPSSSMLERHTCGDKVLDEKVLQRPGVKKSQFVEALSKKQLINSVHKETKTRHGSRLRIRESTNRHQEEPIIVVGLLPKERRKCDIEATSAKIRWDKLTVQNSTRQNNDKMESSSKSPETIDESLQLSKTCGFSEKPHSNTETQAITADAASSQTPVILDKHVEEINRSDDNIDDQNHTHSNLLNSSYSKSVEDACDCLLCRCYSVSSGKLGKNNGPPPVECLYQQLLVKKRISSNSHVSNTISALISYQNSVINNSTLDQKISTLQILTKSSSTQTLDEENDMKEESFGENKLDGNAVPCEASTKERPSSLPLSSTVSAILSAQTLPTPTNKSTNQEKFSIINIPMCTTFSSISSQMPEIITIGSETITTSKTVLPLRGSFGKNIISIIKITRSSQLSATPNDIHRGSKICNYFDCLYLPKSETSEIDDVSKMNETKQVLLDFQALIKQIALVCRAAEIKAARSTKLEQTLVARQNSSVQLTMSVLKLALTNLQTKFNNYRRHIIAEFGVNQDDVAPFDELNNYFQSDDAKKECLNSTQVICRTGLAKTSSQHSFREDAYSATTSKKIAEGCFDPSIPLCKNSSDSSKILSNSKELQISLTYDTEDLLNDDETKSNSFPNLPINPDPAGCKPTWPYKNQTQKSPDDASTITSITRLEEERIINEKSTFVVKNNKNGSKTRFSDLNQRTQSKELSVNVMAYGENKQKRKMEALNRPTNRLCLCSSDPKRLKMREPSSSGKSPGRETAVNNATSKYLNSLDSKVITKRNQELVSVKYSSVSLEKAKTNRQSTPPQSSRHLNSSKYERTDEQKSTVSVIRCNERCETNYASRMPSKESFPTNKRGKSLNSNRKLLKAKEPSIYAILKTIVKQFLNEL